MQYNHASAWPRYGARCFLRYSPRPSIQHEPTGMLPQTNTCAINSCARFDDRGVIETAFRTMHISQTSPMCLRNLPSKSHVAIADERKNWSKPLIPASTSPGPPCKYHARSHGLTYESLYSTSRANHCREKHSLDVDAFPAALIA